MPTTDLGPVMVGDDDGNWSCSACGHVVTAAYLRVNPGSALKSHLLARADHKQGRPSTKRGRR